MFGGFAADLQRAGEEPLSASLNLRNSGCFSSVLRLDGDGDAGAKVC